MLGALGALQIGLFRMRSMYNKVDPHGQVQAELRQLFQISRSCTDNKP